jgi:hypothetical protein
MTSVAFTALRRSTFPVNTDGTHPRCAAFFSHLSGFSDVRKLNFIHASATGLHRRFTPVPARTSLGRATLPIADRSNLDRLRRRGSVQ